MVLTYSIERGEYPESVFYMKKGDENSSGWKAYWL